MPMEHLAMLAQSKCSINVNHHYYYILTRATPSRMDPCKSPGIDTWYPPSVTGEGLGPEEGPGVLGVLGGLGDKAGRKVIGAVSVELRASVVTATVVPAWALTEAQHARSTSKSGGRTPTPIAQPRPGGQQQDRALLGNRGG